MVDRASAHLSTGGEKLECYNQLAEPKRKCKAWDPGVSVNSWLCVVYLTVWKYNTNQWQRA